MEQRSTRSSLATIFLIVFIDLLGFGMLIPILQPYAMNFGASVETTGYIIACFSLMQFIFAPVWGKLSDRYGRKPILMSSMLISVIGYILLATAPSLLIVFIARSLSGLGAGNIAAAQAYIADVTKPEERAKNMGLVGAAFGLGMVCGPIFTTLLGQAFPGRYDVSAWAAAGLSLLAFILSIVMLKESHIHRGKSLIQHHKPLSLKKYVHALTHPRVGILITGFFLISFAFSNIYSTIIPLNREVYGFTDKMNGIMFSVMGVTAVIVQGGLVRVLAKKFDERKILITGNFLMAAGLALMPSAGGNFTLLLFFIVLLALGVGLNNPTTLSLISQRTPSEEQGGILGINQALGSLARVIGPWWGAMTFERFGYYFPFWTGAGIMFLTSLLSIRLFARNLHD